MKVFNKVLLSLLLIQSFTCISQEKDFFSYYALINQADLQNAKGNYQKADFLYQKAFAFCGNKGFANDYFNAAKNAILLDINCLYYLKQGFKNGLLYKIVKQDTIYRYLKNKGNTKHLKKEYKKIRSEYLLTLNIAIRDTISQMVKEDQKYRKGKYERMSLDKQRVFLKQVDAKNYKKLLQICKAYGFPGRSLVGDDGYEIGFVDVPLLLRHLDSTELNIFKPYIVQAIKKGDFHPEHFAFAYDYVTMFKTTVDDLDKDGNHILIIQQQYGMIQRSEKGKMFLFPVESVVKANKLRAEIGLPTLQDYALIIKCDLPKEGFYKRVFKSDATK